MNSDLDLVTSYEKFNPEISWRSDNESVISSNGKFSTPLYTQKVTIFLTVAINESSTTKVYTVNVKGVEYEDKWEAVDVFLKNIYKETIENQRFILYGSEPGYEYVPALNKGYIPFYNNNNSEIKVDLVDQLSADGRYFVNNSGTAIYPNIKKTSTNYIVIHNTGMAAPSATAAGLNRAIHNTTREASWHYSVDDKEIYQHVPNDYVAWHAGDGSTKYGSTWVAKDGKTYIGGGNYNGIGIEMCVYQGIDFNMAMRNTAKLTAELLLQYELNFDGIKQHYDFAGKDCPQVIRQANRMEEFLNLVRIEYFAKTHLKDVKFTFTSLSPDIMDNKGNVINHPGIETMVKYKVTAEYNGKTNEYVFSSKLATLK